MYAVAPGTTIGFSSAGVLEAMRTLPLVVVPAAQPRPLRRPTLVDVRGTLVLPGGLVLAEHDGGSVLLKASRASARQLARRAGMSAVVQGGTAVRMARGRIGDGVALQIGGAAGAVVEGRDRIGVGGALLPFVPIRPRAPQVRKPRDDETALEVPWRLIISPSALEGFTHADEPVPADADPGHVELWHSPARRARASSDGELQRVDESPGPQRIVRAVWNRDPRAHARSAGATRTTTRCTSAWG